MKVVVFGQDPTRSPARRRAGVLGRPRQARVAAPSVPGLASDRPGFAAACGLEARPWARQGVLLLNPTLTIEVGRIGSHLECGWQALTSEIVQALCRRPQQDPRCSCSGATRRRGSSAGAAARGGSRACWTRHPSNDMQRRFMAEGSHFAQTADPRRLVGARTDLQPRPPGL